MITFHRMARVYLQKRAAFVVTYALALYPPLFTIIGAIYVEPMATLSLTLSALFLMRGFRGGKHDHTWAGVALAVLALSRVEYGYVVLAAFLLSGAWLAMSKGGSPNAQRGLYSTGLALLLCVFWLLYTYSLTNKFFYWGNSGGLSLYWMTAPGNLGDWHGQDVFTNPELTTYRLILRQVESLKPLKQDGRLMHIALQNIENDPKHYLSNVVNNVDRLVFNLPASHTYEKRAILYAVLNALLLGTLAIGVLVAFMARRRLQRLQPEIMPIAFFACLGFMIHVPVAAYPRFMIPWCRSRYGS